MYLAMSETDMANCKAFLLRMHKMTRANIWLCTDIGWLVLVFCVWVLNFASWALHQDWSDVWMPGVYDMIASLLLHVGVCGDNLGVV